MATGILGLGSGQAAALNSDMIEKLKAADRKATVESLEQKLENFTKEKDVITNIGTKVDEFLAAVEIFSMNQKDGTNAFQQKSANVSGEGVVFDSDDLSALKTGSMRVEIQELAQKDVWQSIAISGSKTNAVNAGVITINGNEIDTSTMSYEKLTEEINKISGVQASLVDSSDGKFRLAIKSTETGTANKINFNTKDISGNDLGVSSGAAKLFGDGSALSDSLNVLKAQNMQLTADGVDYSSSSNTVTIDGLKITATKKGSESTIVIEDDKKLLSKQMQEFATKYNELRATIEDEIYSAETSIDDKSAINNMLTKIKDILFGTGNSDKTIFSIGFSLDEKSGNLNFNEKTFENSLNNGIKDLENLFVGNKNDQVKGIGTLLDEAISLSGIKKGLMDYELNMLLREETMKKEKELAETNLDSKYSLMAQQFAAYGIIINQMEASFSGLKMMIQQSMVSK